MRAVALILLIVAPAHGSDPAFAVVEITFARQAGSAVVIESDETGSTMLTAAHVLPRGVTCMTLHAPHWRLGQTRTCRVLAVRVNRRDDLAALRIDAQLPYAIPVAPRGTRLAGELSSFGYDSPSPNDPRRETGLAKLHRARARAIRHYDRNPSRTYTDRPPWHGRSGGALVDTKGRLVGIVSAYVEWPQGPGVYVSLEAIHRFLDGGNRRQADPLPPRSLPYAEPFRVPFTPVPPA